MNMNNKFNHHTVLNKNDTTFNNNSKDKVSSHQIGEIINSMQELNQSND